MNGVCILVGAIGFGNSWMLLWALAAAAPLVIHLWQRNRRHVEPWAAMEFLISAVQQRSRSLRLEQYTLLTARTMNLLLLALILADPFWSTTADRKLSAHRQPRHWILVFDTSYSMGAQAGLHRCFDLAKQSAHAIIDRAADGDAFSIVSMGAPVRTIIGRPTFDHQVVRTEIERLQLGSQGANLVHSLRNVESILRQTKKEHEQFTTHHVLWFSDLMHNTWNVSEDVLRSSVKQLPADVTLSVVDVGQKDPLTNLAVSELRRSQGFVTVHDVVEFHVTVESFGTQPVAKTSLEFLVDGQPIDQNLLEMRESIRRVTFRHQFQASGDHLVSVRLPADAIPHDNLRAHVVPVASAIQVLCVEGRLGASAFVQVALAPNKELNERIRIGSIDINQLRDRPLDRYDAVLMCDVPGLDSNQAALLARFVERGGGLVVFLGNSVVPEKYNAFAADGDSPRLLPARLTGVTPAGHYRLDPTGYKHPLVRPFEFHPSTGLLSTPIWKYVTLAPANSPDVAIPLSFENGDAAIVEEDRLRARIIMVATSVSDIHGNPQLAQEPWSLWPVWPSFPPLVHELLQRVVERQDDHRDRLVGESIQGVSPSNAAVSVTLTPESSEPVRVGIDDATGRWSFGETWSRGSMLARYDGLGYEELYCLNVDTSESQLERTPTRELPERMRVFAHDQENSLAQDRSPSGRKHLLSWLFAVLMLGLLAEPLLAWRLGRAR